MTSKKRLVFIIEYLGVNVNSTSYYWTKILELLAINYDVLIITPNYASNVDYLNRSGFDYVLYEPVIFSKSNFFMRLWAYIKMSVSFYGAAKRKIKNDDILISGTNSIFNMFFLSSFKRKFDISWLLFGYDIFPENLIPAQIIKKSNPIYKGAIYIFSKLYSSPNDIVSVGRDMQDLLLLKVNGKTNVHYIPNWADHTEIELLQKGESDILKELHLINDNSIIFQFFGNFGLLQDVKGILEAIKYSKARNAKFIFIGKGSESFAIKETIKQLNDERVIFYGECDMSLKDHALAACDVALVTLKKGMKGLAVPSKSYFSMAANKPIVVVGDEGAELRLLVNDYPIGWGCNSGEPIVLASLIDGICENPKILESFSPRESLINNFSESHSLEKISNLIKNYG